MMSTNRRKFIRNLSTCLLMVCVVMFLTAELSGRPNVLREIARGGPIHGSNGIYFDADDNLYIASFLGREIVVMNPHNGRIVDRLGPEVGVEGPDDVTFGPDGSLYWTSLFTGEVGRLTQDGVLTKQFIAPGVNPITFSSDGRLFVGLDFLGDGLYELDPDLVDPPRPIIVASEANPYPLGFLNAFDFGPDGRLYGPLVALGMVVSIDVDSCNNTSNPWADCDIQVTADGFELAAAVKFDSTGVLHVVDQIGYVYSVDLATGEKSILVELTQGLDNLAFDSRGNLYVSHANDGSIFRILPGGQSRVLSPGGMVAPGGVAILPQPDGNERVYVADLWTMREFDGLTGKDVGLTTSLSLLGIGLTSPLTVSADGDHLVVSYWGASAVQVWDPVENQVLEQYTTPIPINAIRFQDDLVVADLLMGLVWASSGEAFLGQPYFYYPTGLAASSDTLWVADWATGTIWQIGFEGKVPMEPVLVASGLANPEGLALDIDGNLLVVEAGSGCLSHIDLATGAVEIVAEGLALGALPVEGAPPSWYFNGVAVGPSGAIYITGDVGNVLYRIWPR